MIEIRKLTSVWKYVSSEDNPADCPMRGMTFAELKDCKKWWFVPLWLSQGKENWPSQPESLEETDPECLREMKAGSHKQIESDAHESSTYSAVAIELPNVESTRGPVGLTRIASLTLLIPSSSDSVVYD